MSFPLILNLFVFAVALIWSHFDQLFTPSDALDYRLLHPEREIPPSEMTLTRLNGFYACFVGFLLLVLLTTERGNYKFLFNASLAVLLANGSLWYMWYSELDLSDLKVQIADNEGTLYSVLLSASIVTLGYHVLCTAPVDVKKRRVMVDHRV